MEKIFAPADKVLAEIGRFTLMRPWLSGILLLTAILITWLSNNPLSLNRPATDNVSYIPIPEAPTNTNTPAIADNNDNPDVINTSVVATAPSTTAVPLAAKKISPIPQPAPAAKKSSVSDSALNYAAGQISHSLYTDARKIGLSAKQANQLVQIFSQKNIAQNVHPGDQFSVLYESPKTVKQKKYSGNIMAAQITHKDKTYQLLRFTDPKGHSGYYTPQGQTLNEGLLRAPVHFTYISSGFSNNRLDPILHYRRPHLGVDYAAPTGTPVKAAGDGVVEEVSYRGGYGRTVVLRHDDKYSTLYGHLSRYADIRAGDTVQQGEVIGYVGQTGFATGPHLHYEIHVNDVPFNPLTVALPNAYLPKAYRNQFFAQSKPLLAQLNSRQQVRLAQKASAVKRS